MLQARLLLVCVTIFGKEILLTSYLLNKYDFLKKALAAPYPIILSYHAVITRTMKISRIHLLFFETRNLV